MSTVIATDRDVVRELAREVAEIANSKENEIRRKRWCDTNALRKPDRAPVWCRPVGAWAELLPSDQLVCTDRYYRNLEHSFRQILIKADIGDDSVVDPWWEVGAAFDVTPSNTWGVDVKHISTDVNGGAWHYDPPLKELSDFDKLQMPTYTYNPQRTQERMDRMNDLLGDIMPVKLSCGAPGANFQTTADSMRGMNQLLLDMALEPEIVHRLMSHLRDGVLKCLDEIENTGLITPNNRGAMLCSDPINPDNKGTYTLKDQWIMADSQEFDTVSPAMWEEYLLNYQKDVFARYGLVCYGCCENLTKKIEGVLSIPNLRIFVCSAWSDIEKIVEAVGCKYVIMIRDKATNVTFEKEIAPLREYLENRIKAAEGCNYQIILRELQSLEGRTHRLHEWTQMAIELAEKYA